MKLFLMSVVLCLIFVATRIYIGIAVPPNGFSILGVYRVMAHFYMGILVGAWVIQKENWQLALIIVLTVTEILVAVMARL